MINKQTVETVLQEIVDENFEHCGDDRGGYYNYTPCRIDTCFYCKRGLVIENLNNKVEELELGIKQAQLIAERLHLDYLRKCEALAKPKASVAMVAQELRGLAQIRKIVYRSADTTAAFVERLANILDPDGKV